MFLYYFDKYFSTFTVPHHSPVGAADAEHSGQSQNASESDINLDFYKVIILLLTIYYNLVVDIRVVCDYYAHNTPIATTLHSTVLRGKLFASVRTTIGT